MGIRNVADMALFSDAIDALKTGTDIPAQEVATLALYAPNLSSRDSGVSVPFFRIRFRSG